MDTKYPQGMQEINSNVNMKIPEMKNVMVEAKPLEYSAGTVDESMLSIEEKERVNKLAEDLNIANMDQVMKYGSLAQKGISDFSINVLNKVRTKDLGNVGSSLKELTVFLNSSRQPEKKGIGGLFQKIKKGTDSIKANYAKAETNVKHIEKSLEQHQVILAQDISLYGQMYELNLNYYRELTMYIIAGKKVLDLERNNTLQQLKHEAEESQQQEDVERYKEFVDICNRFEKRLYDLELSRVVSLQMAPQIRMLQNNDQALYEKIQSSLVNTIPLWRNQVVVQLGLDHTRRAINAQNEITEATNALIRENAESLRIATTETAKAAERPIVDIETLRKSNMELINSITEVIQIHEDGIRQRKDAQAELIKIEDELKEALLDTVK